MALDAPPADAPPADALRDRMTAGVEARLDLDGTSAVRESEEAGRGGIVEVLSAV